MLRQTKNLLVLTTETVDTLQAALDHDADVLDDTKKQLDDAKRQLDMSRTGASALVILTRVLKDSGPSEAITDFSH